ncbi:MAG: hypothetical protein AAB262_00710 [Elusimicrobiota bacterium]
MHNFHLSRIAIRKGHHGIGDQATIQGEIRNMSTRQYNAVAIRAVLSQGTRLLTNVVFTVYGVSGGETKFFVKSLEDLDYEKTINAETTCYCQVESAF